MHLENCEIGRLSESSSFLATSQECFQVHMRHCQHCCTHKLRYVPGKAVLYPAGPSYLLRPGSWGRRRPRARARQALSGAGPRGPAAHRGRGPAVPGKTTAPARPAPGPRRRTGRTELGPSQRQSPGPGPKRSGSDRGSRHIQAEAANHPGWPGRNPGRRGGGMPPWRLTPGRQNAHANTPRTSSRWSFWQPASAWSPKTFW